MSENGEIYTASKNFTLPPALTALTNFTSGRIRGSVVTLDALVNLALMNTFSVFPYFDFVCSFTVTLITTISNSLMY